MSLYGNRNYYVLEEDYTDIEMLENEIALYTQNLMMSTCNPDTHWGEGLAECGYDEMDYPTPSHAPVEIVQRVHAYWYNTALFIAQRYYEANPI